VISRLPGKIRQKFITLIDALALYLTLGIVLAVVVLAPMLAFVALIAILQGEVPDGQTLEDSPSTRKIQVDISTS
jgi:nucleoside permease NupC